MGTGAKLAVVGAVLVAGYFVVTRMMPQYTHATAPATSGDPGGVGGGSGTLDKIRQGISVGKDAWNLTQDIAGAFGASWGTTDNPTSLKPSK